MQGFKQQSTGARMASINATTSHSWHSAAMLLKLSYTASVTLLKFYLFIYLFI